MKANKAYICVRNNMEYNKGTDNHTIILRYLTGMMKNNLKSLYVLYFTFCVTTTVHSLGHVSPFTKAG